MIFKKAKKNKKIPIKISFDYTYLLNFLLIVKKKRKKIF
jgi:hypothetical protein